MKPRRRLTMRILRGIQTACSQVSAGHPEEIPGSSEEQERDFAEVVDALAWVNQEIERRTSKRRPR